jgi:hypothetical protein
MLNTISRLKRLIARLDQQPLFTFEWQVAQRQIPVIGKWTRRFNLMVAWWVVLMSIVLFLSELIRALLGGDLNIVPYSNRWLMGVYALLALIFYTTPLRLGQTVAQQMIGRDKSKPENWEMIVLTGIDARTYVLAKWWRIVRGLLPTILYTGIVRAGAVTFLVAEFTRSLAASAQGNSASGVIVYPPGAFDILVVGLLSLMFPYIQLPGLAARYVESTLDSRRNGNTVLGVFMRNMIMFSVGIFVIIGATFLLSIEARLFNNISLTLVLGMFLLTVVDNGLVITGQLAAFTYVNARYVSFDTLLTIDVGQVLLIVLLILPVTVGITQFWLQMAERTAQRYELVPAEQTAPFVSVERLADASTPREAIR